MGSFHIKKVLVLDALKEEKVVEKNAKWDDVPFWRPKKDVDPEQAYQGRIAIQHRWSCSAKAKSR
jgi:hypothetical protein